MGWVVFCQSVLCTSFDPQQLDLVVHGSFVHLSEPGFISQTCYYHVLLAHSHLNYVPRVEQEPASLVQDLKRLRWL